MTSDNYTEFGAHSPLTPPIRGIEWPPYTALVSLFKEDEMDFFLRYRGALPACTQGNPRTAEKHHIRTYLSPQLRDMWRQIPPLIYHMPETSQVQEAIVERGRVVFNSDGLIKLPRMNVPRDPFCAVPFKGWRFIPLIGRPLKLACKLDLRILRREEPGAIVHGGDLDNRLKTLFDGLRIPLEETHVPCSPEEGKNPNCYCLLEDDSLIAHVNIETGRLWGPLGDQEDENDVELTMHVTVKVREVTIDNILWQST